MVEQSRSVRVGFESILLRAELRAEIFFECGNDSGAEVTDLRVGQSGFAALKRDSNEQRIFSCRDIFAAKKIRCFDAGNFRNIERADGIPNADEMGSIGQEQREIPLDTGEARQGLVAPSLFCGTNRRAEPIKFEFREKNILTEFEFFRDLPRELARGADFVRTELQAAAACGVQPGRAAFVPFE